MQKVALILMVALLASGEGSPLAPGLRVKFGMDENPSAGTSYFFKIPVTVSEAVAEGWRQTCRPPGPLPQLEMYCPRDNVICALFDDLKDVAGIQIALSRSNFTNNVFDWEKRGFSLWHTAVDGKSVTMYTQLQLFASEESLRRSKEERLQARDPSRILKENALWVTGTDGELRKIPSNEQDISDEQVFLKQACMAGMGQHWFYNMSRSTPCDAENIYPWFTNTFEGEIVSSGFVTIGKLPIGSYRDWLERPTLEVVEAIIPRESGPDCLYELATERGVVTMHIYYTDTPWLITC